MTLPVSDTANAGTCTVRAVRGAHFESRWALFYLCFFGLETGLAILCSKDCRSFSCLLPCEGGHDLLDHPRLAVGGLTRKFVPCILIV